MSVMVLKRIILLRCSNQEYRLPQNSAGKLPKNRYVANIIEALRNEGTIQGESGIDKEESPELVQNYILPENHDEEILNQFVSSPAPSGDINDLFSKLGEHR